MQQVKSAFAKATALIQADDLSMAEAVCREALQQYPGENNLSCLLGAILVRLRRPQEAEPLLRGVTESVPEFAKAHDELANAILAQNQPERAIPSLERAIELEPRNDLAKYKLGEVLAETRGQGRGAGKKTLGETDKLLMDAAQFRSQGNYAAAEEAIQAALSREPDNSVIYQQLGALVMEQQQFADATIFLKRATSLAPDNASAWIDLGSALAGQHRYPEAEQATRKAIELQPDAPRSWQMLAGIQSRAGAYDAAVDSLKHALGLQPDSVDLLLAFGHSLRTIGRHDDAVAAYRRAIEQSASAGGGWWSLANLKDYAFSEEDRRTLQQQLSRDDLGDGDRVKLCFAAGKAAEDAGDFDAAFESFSRGNEVRRRREIFDPVANQQRVDELVEEFQDDPRNSEVEVSEATPVPIFIVGMPRSGTTLVEQILASHSLVDGTRELPYAEQLVRRAVPDGQWYVDQTAIHRGSAPHFTDKAPGNFWHIGQLAKLLPQAKFINVRRHPLDSCMGSFKQLFATGQPWSYDLFEIGEYCLGYRRLLDHWHALMPGVVLDVDYEDIVNDLDGQVERMLDYCGLPMEAACLAFHETERAVESASSEQVRQPLYTTAVNHWRNYEKHLGELIEALQPVVPAERSQK